MYRKIGLLTTVFAVAVSLAVGIGAFSAKSLHAQTNDLHPGVALSGDDLALWEGLTQEYQDIFFGELLPAIKTEASEHSDRVDAIAVAVAVLADIQEQDEEHSSDYTASGRVRCYFSIRFSHTSGLSYLRCMATMAKIRTKLRVSQQYGPAIYNSSDTCWDCSSEKTLVFFSPTLRSDRVWIANGWGYPTSYPGGPHPQYYKYYDSKCLPIRCRL